MGSTLRKDRGAAGMCYHGGKRGGGMARFKGVVFMDRDGTVIVHHPYLSDVSRVQLIPGAGEAVARLNAAGMAAVVVSNQSGVARGLITEAALSAIHRRLHTLLASHGARLDALFYCPHHPEAPVARYRRACRCRKPAPGMVERAIHQLGLEGLPAWVIGDDARDLELAETVGAHGVLVRTGLGAATEQRLRNAEGWHGTVVDDLRAAVSRILEASGH